MADLITTGTSGYSSGSIDTASTLVNNVSPIDAKHPNGLAAAIVQLEGILGSGVTLKGSMATLVARLAVIIAADGLLKAATAIPSPVLSGTVTGTYTLGGTATLPNTLIAGTIFEMNPYVVSTASSVLHTLGTTPTMVNWYLQCLSTELGYSVNDRVFSLADVDSGGGARGFTLFAEATTLGITTNGTLPQILHKTTGASVAITAAKWKLVATAYKRT